MDDGSPLMKAKIQKLNNMKHILNELFVNLMFFWFFLSFLHLESETYHPKTTQIV